MCGGIGGVIDIVGCECDVVEVGLGGGIVGVVGEYVL